MTWSSAIVCERVPYMMVMHALHFNAATRDGMLMHTFRALCWRENTEVKMLVLQVATKLPTLTSSPAQASGRPLQCCMEPMTSRLGALVRVSLSHAVFSFIRRPLNTKSCASYPSTDALRAKRPESAFHDS